MTKKPNWLASAQWGLMFHYLDKAASSNAASETTVEQWNQRVESFDVPRFAQQVQDLGADYVIFTLGQNTGHFCSPNATYDSIVGSHSTKLSRRDLVLEIAEALAPGIRLIAYLPSHAPANDMEAVRSFGLVPPWDASMCGLPEAPADWPKADERLTEFQTKWEAVVAEWGFRWGSKVSGWWIDGCYFAEKMYHHADAPNFSSFARALRAGNPERLLAFNSGTAKPFERLSAEQDYTAGEVSTKFPVSNKWERLETITDGMNTHVLSYLGTWWGEGEPRFESEYVKAYTDYLNSCGVVMTWDVPIHHDGSIEPGFVEALGGLSDQAHTSPNERLSLAMADVL